jgi:hypothetical protein
MALLQPTSNPESKQMPDDTTARDALERGLHYRLPLCSEEELRALDRMLVGIEKRRELLEVGRQVSASESVVERELRELRALGGIDRIANQRALEAALAELRASMTYGPLADAGTSVIGDNS